MSAFPDTPVSLLARLAAERTGQSQADWTRFFELYQPVIEKFAAFVGAKREAEDVSQDIFLKLVEVFRDSTYEPSRGSFRAYLATMIRREVVNRWHKANVRAADRHISIDNEEHPVELAAAADPASSTVAELKKGTHFIGKKIVEEAGEVWIASEYEGKERTAEEISQLLYHLQVMMIDRGLTLNDIYRFL